MKFGFITQMQLSELTYPLKIDSKRDLLTRQHLSKLLNRNLKLETKQPEILKEGSSKNIKGAQAYLIYAFTDKRGIRLMQLCQYYATEDRFLQLIITDRIEGFRNLEKIISEIHESFKILKPNLQ